jgi:hypothetical protein
MPVADDQVRMRVAGIIAGGVYRREPCRLIPGQIVGKVFDQALPIREAEFARQSHDHPVDDPGVPTVGFLLRIEPRPGRFRITGHPCGLQDRFG